MRPLTMNEALALAESFEVSPETTCTDGNRGEVHFYCPNIGPEDWNDYLEVVTGGISVDRSTITVKDAGVEEGEIPCVQVVIRTEG